MGEANKITYLGETPPMSKHPVGVSRQWNVLCRDLADSRACRGNLLSSKISKFFIAPQ